MLHKDKRKKKNSELCVDLNQNTKDDQWKNTEGTEELYNLQQLFASASFLDVHFQATVEEISEDRRQLLRVLKLGCAVCGNQV